MSDYLINDKAEEAFASLVTGLVAGLDPVPEVRAGASDEDTSTDALKDGLIEITAEGQGDEEVQGTGNFWVAWTIALKYASVPNEDGSNPDDDPLARAQAAVTAVTNGIVTDSLSEDLTAEVDFFTVYSGSVTFEAPTREQDPAGFWVYSIKGKMLCCAADI